MGAIKGKRIIYLYRLLSDAAKMFGISYKTVKARLLSDKFPTWRYE